MAEAAEAEVARIVDCRPLQTDLTVEVKVLVCAVVSDAGKRKVTECLVGDSSATILFKARGREAEELTEGRSLRIQGCKVDMFHGSMRLVCQPEASIDEITDVSPKKDINMSLLEFETVITNAYAKGGAAKDVNGADGAAAGGGGGDAAQPDILDGDAFPAMDGGVAAA